MQNFAEYRCVVQLHGSEHTRHFRWFRSFSVVQSFQFEFATHPTYIQGKHSRSTDRKYNYRECWCYVIRIKRCFPHTNLIVSPCACDLFVSRVTKITQYMDDRFWRSFFGAFSVCDDCILKSTTAWLLKLSVLYIHSFMQVHNTIFQIKTVFNNVLFSTEVHNPLHAHLLALSHI